MPVTQPTLIVQVVAAVSSAAATVTGSVSLRDGTPVQPPVGSAPGDVDGCFSVTGTVTAGTPVQVDLTALRDPVGAPLTVGHVVALKASNTGSAGNLSVGGGTSPALPALPVPVSPGSSAVVHDAGGTLLPVAAGSTQYVQLAASAGTVPFTLSGLTRSL